MKTKIIFLDIDGVLIKLESQLDGDIAPDPTCVDNLNQLVHLTGAKIVVSSSWKKLGLEKIADVLSGWGVKGEVISITPAFDDAGSEYHRWRELQQWIDDFATVSSFVILDDYTDMGKLVSHLVITDEIYGLTQRDVDLAIAILDQA